MQRAILHLISGFLIALAALSSQVALADDAPSIPVECHRFEILETDISAVRSDPTGWICDGSSWRTKSQATWIRFAVSDWTGDEWQPTILAMRTARFEQLGVFVENWQGQLSFKLLAQSAISPVGRGPYATVQLPQISGDIRYVYARLEGTQLPSTGSQAQLFESQSEAGWPLGQSLAIATLLGLVLVPFFFDLTLYPILKKPYLLWHAGIVAGMLVSLAAGTGVAAAIIPLSINNVVGGLEIGFVIIISAACFFSVSFVERDALSHTMRRALIAAAIINLLLSGILAFGFPIFHWVDHQLYLLGFFPALIATVCAMIQALWRGSYWVRYQVVGWIPGIFCGLDIVSAAFGFTVHPILPDTAPYFAMAFEVAVTGIGVINRLMLLRRERDYAMEEARTLEKLSERDPMTGLLNRRAIDARFRDLHLSGYESFAAIDLDHFKQVNDIAGHAKGDEVLKIVGSILKNEANCIAIRLGGEEFLLLLKGDDAFERAERVRKTIPVRIAREVLGLEQIVTASMGLIEVPRAAMPNAEFSDIYTYADRLLYEAKEQGRNRTVSEKMRAFRRRSRDRRRRNAA